MPISSTASDRSELQAAINAVPYFYHKIDLGGGVVTPGWAPIDAAAYRVPERMDGQRVLDIGTWDGYWCFEALRRGAAEAIGIEDFSDTIGTVTNADRSTKFQTFDLCAAALGYNPPRCRRYECSVYASEWLGKFDAVFAFGLLYHLRHPLLALERLRAVCTGTLFVETAIMDGVTSPYTGQRYNGNECLAEFYPHDEYGRNASNWHVGTLRYWVAMVEAAGFRIEDAWRLTDTPKSLSQCRGFIRAKA